MLREEKKNDFMTFQRKILEVNGKKDPMILSDENDNF